MNPYSDLAVANSGNLSNGISSLLQGRIAGNNPGLRAKFRAGDEALGTASATARANSMQTLPSGVINQARTRRNLQGADDSILKAVAGNALNQEQAQATDQEHALSLGQTQQAYQQRNLEDARTNAMDMGDMGTAAALGGIFTGQGGYDPTQKLRDFQARSAGDAAGLEGWAADGSAAPNTETSMMKRMRFSSDPPQRSVRLFDNGERN